MKIALLILAAGESRRMGSPKQLLAWEHTTLLGHAIETAISSRADQVLVLLGAEASDIRNSLNMDGIEIIVNEDWKEGLGSTIRKGVTFIESLDPVPDAVLLMLADQPLLGVNHLDKLISEIKKGDVGIVCTTYDKKLGVPAVFIRKYFRELSQLQGDRGAGKLIASHSDQAVGIAAGRNVVDLDTPQDYLSLRRTQLKTDT